MVNAGDGRVLVPSRLEKKTPCTQQQLYWHPNIDDSFFTCTQQQLLISQHWRFILYLHTTAATDIPTVIIHSLLAHNSSYWYPNSNYSLFILHRSSTLLFYVQHAMNANVVQWLCRHFLYNIGGSLPFLLVYSRKSVLHELCIEVLLKIQLRRANDFSFFDCSSTFCFLLIEFHCTFSISYTILTNLVYYYSILIMIV